MRKKAQEEIVGFVAIVVIMLIVAVIFLGIYLRQDPTSINQESKNVHSFLESSMQYTTSCATSFEPAYSKLDDLIRECHSGLSTCTSGQDPCTLAKSTMMDLINAGFLVSDEAEIKGYEFKSIYTTNSTQSVVLEMAKGNCSNSIIGSEVLIPEFPGTISNSLSLCL
jgi:hypothetical protein